MGGRMRALVADSARGDGPAVADELDLVWEPASTVSDFLSGFPEGAPDIVVISLGMEGVDAAFVARIAEITSGSGTGVFLSAPRASLEWAVMARRLGSGPLLQEPLSAGELRPVLRRRIDRPDGVRIKEASDPPEGPGLVGSGPAMMDIVRSVAEVGDSAATVLITGESGTGKELVARALHWTSARRDGPFVAINCAAVPENLLEAEFFGHERGAFTGAVARRQGRFERAEGGTLFLDEVGDMSLVLQAKLLRVIEEREFERVGGEASIPSDVRILAATNHRLEDQVAQGGFREDLYYRLAVARLHVPPLRERTEDLEALACHFVGLFSHAYGKAVQGIGSDALRLLARHPWPGNVRELRNVLDRAVLNCPRGGWIRGEDLALGDGSPSLSSRGGEDAPSGYPPTVSLADVEKDHIGRVLKLTGGAMAEAAEILGIHRNTLTRKVERYGIRVRRDHE